MLYVKQRGDLFQESAGELAKLIKKHDERPMCTIDAICTSMSGLLIGHREGPELPQGQLHPQTTTSPFKVVA